MRASTCVATVVFFLGSSVLGRAAEELSAPLMAETAPLLSPSTMAIGGVFLVGAAMLRARFSKSAK